MTEIHKRAVRCQWAIAAAVLVAWPQPPAACADDVDGYRPAALSTPVLAVSRLEPTETVIRRILIDNRNIFDLTDPAEDGLLHHLLNATHVRTRPEIIRRQLLLSPGEPLSPGDVEETERLLRNNDFLSEAEIVPVAYGQGQVDLEVRTRDTWSLTPSVSFSRKGGENTGGLGVKESNLFGTGTTLEFGYRSGLDRDSTHLSFHDGQLGKTRLQLTTAFADNSDGSLVLAALEQPFYSLDSRRAGGFRLQDFDQADSIYELGDVTDRLRHRGMTAEAWYGWSAGLRAGWTRRTTLGLAYDEHRFSAVPDEPLPAAVPDDRRLVYPFLGVEWIQDRYETTRNVEQIQVVEDRHLGARLAARLGYASEILGADADAWLTELSASRGFRPSADDTMLLGAAFRSRVSNRLEDAYRLETSLRYYHRHSDSRLLFGELRSFSVANPDTDGLLTLGGDSGLRAYPVRYQSGTANTLLTLEERYYSDWYPFHLFRVGAAVFFDAGRTWGGAGDPGTDLGLLTDAGLGLRIGSPHSSTGRMLHVDLAWPLSGPAEVRGPQLVIETRKHF